MDTILIDIRTSGLTISEALEYVAEYIAANPGHEVYIDGDRHAIVSCGPAGQTCTGGV